MDYEIDLNILKSKSTDFNTLKNKNNNIVDAYNNSYIRSCNEIRSITNSLDDLIKRLDQSYTSCDNWLNNYNTELESTENNIANFSIESVDPPIDFNGKFEDIFGKKVIPTLKEGANTKINESLGVIKTTGGTSAAVNWATTTAAASTTYRVVSNKTTSSSSAASSSSNFVKTTVAATEGADKAIDWAYDIANDNTHGYSQSTRWGNPNYDCSSFVISAYEAAGVPVKENGATYTGNMKQAFLKSGFIWIPGNPNVNDLQPGDVLLSESHHTELYVGNGRNLGAHSNYDGRDGDSSGSEIDEGNYYSFPWDGVLRYVGN